MFVKRSIFIPPNNRCCESHLLHGRLFENDIMILRAHGTVSLIEVEDLMKYFRRFGEGRSIIQALVMFQCKLHHGSSNASIAAIFKLDRVQQVSDIVDSVINASETDVLPFKFGFRARSQGDLIVNETSEFAKKLHGVQDCLALIYDGAYISSEKFEQFVSTEVLLWTE